MADSPYYRFFRYIKYPLPFKQWKKLPRLLTHKNEYWDGHVRLSARPMTCDVILPLAGWQRPISPGADERPCQLELAIRQLQDQDWAELPPLYHSAFAQQQPLYSWNTFAQARASRAIIRNAQIGGDGPLVRKACFVAHGRLFRRRKQESLELCGAALVTLVPISRVSGVDKSDAIPLPEQPASLVVPHLDWIFVSQHFQASGVATMLLEDVVSALRNSGFRTLTSTILLENATSMRWHWRNGFILPARPWGGASLPVRMVQ